MAASPNRGELDVRLGGIHRTLRFRTAETMLLQKRLECDVLAYLARGGGTENFLVEAIFCGLSRDKKAKINPMRVASWLDDEDKPPQVDGVNVTREELQKEVLYAIARGKPKEEAEDFVRVLDEIYSDEESATAPEGNGAGAPSRGASLSTPKETTSSASRPPSA